MGILSSAANVRDGGTRGDSTAYRAADPTASMDAVEAQSKA
jgi:hypothetical protein